MAGHTRYELTSASPDSGFSGSYQNGQRGYLGPTLDRSSSLREGSDVRMFGFGKATPRGNSTSPEMPGLSQCLMLDPITLGDKKNVHSAELRRVLCFSVGSGSEDSSFGANYLKNSPPVAVEELKRFRENVADTCVKASGRAKQIDEHLNKLNKYVETMSLKKVQRLEPITSERSSGSTLKIGSHIHRNSSELGNHKLDDRPKNVVLNKRIRSSVTETRVDSRNHGVTRTSLIAKERELVKFNHADSYLTEEKIRRLPASGEGWDKKMKRKRSVGAVFSRSADSDGELKRTMHHKLTIEPSLQAKDSAHSFRSGASSGSKKLNSTSPVGSSPRISLKNEQEKSSKEFSLGPNKERTFGKGSVKLTNREENHSACPSPIIKGKASRAPRSGSIITTNPSFNIPRVPGTVESWEQPQVVNKTSSTGVANNRKRAVPAGSSSPPITQWGGQRPHKISRTRRTNLMPVSNQDEVQMQFEACSPSSFGPRLSNGGTNATLLSKRACNGAQNFKVKPENVASPARLSESEESGVGENKIKDRGFTCGNVEEKGSNLSQNIETSAIPSENSKNVVKKEIVDGVRRQECSGRVTPFPRGSISPLRENMDSLMPTKPMRNVKSGSDKNGSKSGRRLKKLAERKGFPRFGHLANGGSPDWSGESEDDHEELLEAANLAYNCSLNACPSEFWKTFDSLFASIPDEKASLLLKDDYGQEEVFASATLSCGRNRFTKNEIGLKDSLDTTEFVQQLQNSSLLQHADALNEHVMSTPFYQRVLSALIVDVDFEEYEENGYGRTWNSVNDSCFSVGSEFKEMNRPRIHDPALGSQTQKTGNLCPFFPGNGNPDLERIPSNARGRHCNGELLQRDGEYIVSEVQLSVRREDYIPKNFPVNNGSISPIECSYEQMSIDEKVVLELQSLGLLEPIPDLDDKEDEAVNQEIYQLERRLHEQNGKKKTSLDKICLAVQEFKNDGIRNPEQVAMDKLVELAYKKLLATKGSYATKHGITKVPKQDALAFIKRTLARCRKFEDSGVGCFSEPVFREIIYAAPPRFSEAEMLTHANLGTAKGISIDAFSSSAHQLDHAFVKNGPPSNRLKKKEVLLDDVGMVDFRASSSLGMSGGAKGKRSERDTSNRNANAKAGRTSICGSKDDRKTKLKPKQKTAQLCTSGNGFVNKFVDTANQIYGNASGSGDSANDGVHRKKDVRFKSSGNFPPVSLTEIKEPIDATSIPLKIGGMDELGIDSEVGVPQDFNSWFSFELDGGQEHDFVGLPTPMDELTDIF